MSEQVVVYAQPDLTEDELSDLEAAVRDLGLEPSTRVLPARRGVVEASWLVLIAFPAQVMLRSTLDRLGSEAYDALKRLAARGFHARSDAARPDRAVVLQTTDTGAHIRLEADLPSEAYASLVEILHGTSGGEWRYDRTQQRWREAAAG
jgi:hypothetical protein